MSEAVQPAAGTEHKSGPVAISLDDQRKAIADVARLAAEHGLETEVPAWLERGLSRDQVAHEILSRKRAEAKPIATPAGHLDIPAAEAKRFNMSKAIMAIVDKRWEGYRGIEKEAHDAIVNRSGRVTSGFFVPLDLKVEQRAAAPGNVAGTPSLGGYGIETKVMPLIEILRNRMKVRELGATIMTGLTGNVAFPRQITPNQLNWTGENPATGNPNTAATFENVPMAPKTAMVSSAYSRQLLAQSSFDAAQFVQDDMASVAALGLDAAAIVGTGASNQPTGILNQAGVNVIAMGTNGGFPDWPKLVSFETALAQANADLGTLAWLTTPGVRGSAKTALKNNVAGAAYLWGDDSTVAGYRATVSNQVPSNLTKGTAVGTCHALLFGFWSALMIGEWGGTMEVIVDPYTLASQNMVQVHQYFMADIVVRYPKCFAVSKDVVPS